MRRSIVFVLMALTLIMALVLPVQSANAASNGQITNVCVSGSVVYVTVSAVGTVQDNPSGDQIGIVVDSILSAWPSIPADNQAHTVVASFQLANYQLQAPILVQAGDADGNRNPIGAPFAGSRYYAATGCNFAVVGAPAGFVLRTIICTVPVFDTPGGTPVGSNIIRGGQTWFVNPTSVNDNFGRQWTEIFVAGPQDGFIPTTCVL